MDITIYNIVTYEYETYNIILYGYKIYDITS